MRTDHSIRSRANSLTASHSVFRLRPALDRPGAFECAILRSCELRKEYRDVFLLNEIQGYTLAEIATILGISIDTASARLVSARRAIGHLGDSDAMEPTR